MPPQDIPDAGRFCVIRKALLSALLPIKKPDRISCINLIGNISAGKKKRPIGRSRTLKVPSPGESYNNMEVNYY
jgi:hypothetical protein